MALNVGYVEKGEAKCVKPRHSFFKKGKTYTFFILRFGDYRVIDDGNIGNTMSKEIFNEQFEVQ